MHPTRTSRDSGPTTHDQMAITPKKIASAHAAKDATTPTRQSQRTTDKRAKLAKLFTTNDGTPLVFFLRPCPLKAQIRRHVVVRRLGNRTVCAGGGVGVGRELRLWG